MILSASRRTDIPNYYSDWFFSRIKEGFVYVRNPMNLRQVSKISLDPDVVDCIVFWSKNPEPMLGRLDELAAYRYYFQFTLTGYGQDMELNVPHKKEAILPIFQELSRQISKQRVIWRYDPILFTQKYTPEYHLKAFSQIAAALKGYTDKCVISFVDLYSKNLKNMNLLHFYQLPAPDLFAFTKELSQIALANQITLASCAEKIDLEPYGVVHNRCIDPTLIESITGRTLNLKKDKGQRPECGCVESIDIGTYNTCQNGCKYCYANYSRESAAKNYACYDPASPILCGKLHADDRITERKMKSVFI